MEGTHEAIIDRDLWDRVQSIIAARAKPFDVGTVGLFARKVRCANCGYTMRSSKNRGKHYLQCSNRHVAKDACIGSFIAVDKLDKIVIQELNTLSQRYRRVQPEFRAAKSGLSEGQGKTPKAIGR